MNYSKYNHKIEDVWFHNRWKEKHPNCDWTIVGVSKWWSGPTYFVYKICFFGIELRIGINRIFKP